VHVSAGRATDVIGLPEGWLTVLRMARTPLDNPIELCGKRRLWDFSRRPRGDPAAVAQAIVRAVDAPFGKRPYRLHVDPSQDGAEIVHGVGDRVRAELLRRIGLADTLKPHAVNS